jgi:hypothetical protein
MPAADAAAAASLLLLLMTMMRLLHVVHTPQPMKAHRVLTVHMKDYIGYNTAHDPFLCFVPSRAAAATPWAFLADSRAFLK